MPPRLLAPTDTYESSIYIFFAGHSFSPIIPLKPEWSLKAFFGHIYFRVTSGYRCQNSENHEKNYIFRVLGVVPLGYLRTSSDSIQIFHGVSTRYTEYTGIYQTYLRFRRKNIFVARNVRGSFLFQTGSISYTITPSSRKYRNLD